MINQFLLIFLPMWVLIQQAITTNALIVPFIVTYASIFSSRIVNIWNRLPNSVVDASTIDTFTARFSWMQYCLFWTYWQPFWILQPPPTRMECQLVASGFWKFHDDNFQEDVTVHDSCIIWQVPPQLWHTVVNWFSEKLVNLMPPDVRF